MQYSLLNHLKRLGPLTMHAFSQAMRLEFTTIVRNLKPLGKFRQAVYSGQTVMWVHEFFVEWTAYMQDPRSLCLRISMGRGK